ncbi:MAG: hypothetical protein HY268_29180 [Deltaproteobacteria bacterium]|nr:hypothetical protein [Deltaproteobacteria bacterium]
MAHVEAHTHTFTQEADVLAGNTKQRHERKSKGDILTAITMNDTGLIPPEDFADDAVVEQIPRLLSATGQRFIPFHT